MTAVSALSEPIDAALARTATDWQPIVQDWRASAAGRGLVEFIAARQRAGATIYPAALLRALELTPRRSVRCVILGQDPYHGPGQAEGLAFSVPAGVAVPPSLRNIRAELARERAAAATAPPAPNGHLGAWARQGVLLLNAVLTVERGCPGAHARRGWEALTDALIAATAADPGAKVYLLWGAHAQAKAALIRNAGAGRHCVLTANHPSPLSARRPPQPFIGCGHFGQANRFLTAQPGSAGAIDWWG